MNSNSKFKRSPSPGKGMRHKIKKRNPKEILHELSLKKQHKKVNLEKLLKKVENFLLIFLAQ